MKSKKSKRLLIIFLLLVVLMGWGLQVFGKMFLFSEVQGVVLKNGKPVEGAVVQQEYLWHWSDQLGHKEVKTNVKGEFNFPQVIGFSFLGLILPHEPVIKQTLMIKIGDQSIMAWAYDKRDYDFQSELGGKLIHLKCDLASPLSHKGPRNDIYGICDLL